MFLGLGNSVIYLLRAVLAGLCGIHPFQVFTDSANYCNTRRIVVKSKMAV
jgi:hypothetical protein